MFIGQAPGRGIINVFWYSGSTYCIEGRKKNGVKDFLCRRARALNMRINRTNNDHLIGRASFTFVRWTGHISMRQSWRRWRRAKFHFRVIEFFFVIIDWIICGIVLRGFFTPRSKERTHKRIYIIIDNNTKTKKNWLFLLHSRRNRVDFIYFLSIVPSLFNNKDARGHSVIKSNNNNILL